MVQVDQRHHYRSDRRISGTDTDHAPCRSSGHCATEIIGDSILKEEVMSAKEVSDYAKKNKTVMVDLKFVDFPGTWQHFTIPIEEPTDTCFTEGMGFGGSSIRGWQAIQNSDMMVVPDPETAVMDPFTTVPTLSMICNIVDPITRQNYSRDPRNVAQKAEKYLKQTKIGDISYWGPEAEFFIFDTARYDQNSHSGYYFIDSDEGIWNAGKEGANLGNKPRHKEGYFPVARLVAEIDIRSEMVLEMQKMGIMVAKQHNEVSTAGQVQMAMRYDSLTNMSDKMMMYKYIIKNVARRHGKTVTHMPKPLFQDNGSGMHTLLCLCRDAHGRAGWDREQD